MGKALIQLVEDDGATIDLVKKVLGAEGFNVAVAQSVLEGRRMIEKCRPDLVILDRNLPDKDGLELCRELRSTPDTQALPILFLTGKKSLPERVVGLRVGADDYLTKPFGPEELVARVEALLRRMQAAGQPASVLALEGLELNADAHTVAIKGKPVHLTTKEFDLLKLLLERHDRVLTRRFLLSQVWGFGLDLEINTKSVDMMVSGLRGKLGPWGDKIETVRGHGYILRARQ